MSKHLNVFSFLDEALLETLPDDEKALVFRVLLAFNNGRSENSIMESDSRPYIIANMAIHSFNVVFDDESELSETEYTINVVENKIEVLKSDLDENESSRARISIDNNYNNNYNNNINNTIVGIEDREREGFNEVKSQERETKNGLNLDFKDDKIEKEDQHWPNSKEFFNAVKNSWNRICVSLPEVVRYGKNLGSGLAARTREMEFKTQEEAISFFESMFTKIQQSNYLTGKVKDWSASFDWVFCHPTNFTNILNGKYRNGSNRKSDSERTAGNFGTYKPKDDIKVITGAEGSMEDLDGFDFGDFER